MCVCMCMYICMCMYVYVYVCMCIILCNACIVIIIFTNVIYFINLFIFIVNTLDSIFRDMRCLNKLDLIDLICFWQIL